MPNVLDIRRRIRSVKNTQQITRAMKMVAAARLRRAQERVVSARPYANQILAVLGRVAVRMAAKAEERDQPWHPLLVERPVKRTLLVLVTADRGLSGAFNANLIRAAQGYLARHEQEDVSMIAVGRKGRDFFRKHRVNLKSDYVNLFTRLEFSHAQEIAREIIELYGSESVDAVDFIYNEFKSIMAQRLVVERYLPVKPFRPPEGEAVIDYLYEQPPEQIFNSLLPRYVESQIYRALLESQAAELAAKMTAMDAATNNAAELIDSLTLYLNRVRQAAITKEIIEIVSGAAQQ
jgi:F-type H+-transporting ATPase subunit gamma